MNHDPRLWSCTCHPQLEWLALPFSAVVLLGLFLLVAMLAGFRSWTPKALAVCNGMSDHQDRSRSWAAIVVRALVTKADASRAGCGSRPALFIKDVQGSGSIVA